MLGDLYADQTERAARELAQLPPEPPKREPRSVWGAVLRGPAAGGAELLADFTKLRAGIGERIAGALALQPEPEDSIHVQERQALRDTAAAAQKYAESLRPDPSTASTAEQLVFGLARGLPKAIGAVVALGPVGGAAAFGGSEGSQEYQRLRAEGVDEATATLAGTVVGVVGGGSILLPMVGSTVARTAGLYVAGGPGGFMAQQAATRQILEGADYDEIARQYDPFDPLGLALSAAVPLPFAAAGVVRNVRVARAAAGAQKAREAAPAVPREAAPQAATQAEVDAAMVHNLTLQADEVQARIASSTSTGTPSTSSSSALPNDAGITPPVDAGFMPASSSILGQTRVGHTADVVTERGMEVPVRYRLVEAGELVTSHTDDLTPNAAFPPELQPRDRSRAASAEQIARIENRIRPELLGESVRASDGAPIVGGDLIVESGNARTIALRRAYESGKAEGYRDWLAANARRFGLLEDDVRSMRQPVLVRERIGEVDRAEFARQANESAVAAMSAAEQARADALRMRDLADLATNDDGTINTRASAPFVARFLRDVAPTERGRLLQADGTLSQEGQTRLRNAVFARAYGDSELVAMLAESTDSNVRNILNGLLRAAPEVARLRDLIEAGARQPIDVSAAMSRAAREFARLREQGMTVQQMLEQGSLFGDALPPEITNLMVGLAENARAPRRIAELLRQMVRAVDELGDPRQAGMFDEAAPANAVDTTAGVVERLRTISDAQLADVEQVSAITRTDPLMRSVADRLQQVETTMPDMAIALDAEGRPITVADELARIRREAMEGTDTELGVLDADLVRVAADCALASGVV